MPVPTIGSRRLPRSVPPYGTPVKKAQSIDDALSARVAEDEYEREDGDEGERHDERRHHTTHEMARNDRLFTAPAADGGTARHPPDEDAGDGVHHDRHHEQHQPTSNSAEWYMFVVASLNSLAMARHGVGRLQQQIRCRDGCR